MNYENTCKEVIYTPKVFQRKRMSDALNKAREYEKLAAGRIAAMPQQAELRPHFHFASPAGWINDPNGFSFFGGKCHLFFQYYPYAAQWGAMHWGHAVTDDFVRWQYKGAVLAPDTPADCAGCFSGTAIDDGGQHLIAYTGVIRENGGELQQQCIASGDGETYTKLKENPVVTAESIPFPFQKNHFRDPKIWKENGTYFMAAAVKKENGGGALVLFCSQDLRAWKFVSTADESTAGMSGMWECPDIFHLDGKDIIIISPQEMKENKKLGFHCGNNCVYMTGTLDRASFRFQRDIQPENGFTAAQIDGGIDFYAAQTALSPDGRRILIAWMQNWESCITPKGSLWSGMMTFPRELHLRNGRLCQAPVRELNRFRKSHHHGTLAFSQDSKTEQTLGGIKGRCCDIELTVTVPGRKCGSISFQLAKRGSCFAELKYDANAGTLIFDRSRTPDGGSIPVRSMNVQAKNGTLFLRLLLDISSLETFINGGEAAFTNTFFISPDSDGIAVTADKGFHLEYDFYSIEA